MKFLHYFEGPEIKRNRVEGDAWKRLVDQQKRELRAAEEEVRQKLERSREALERAPVAGALTGRTNGAQ
jgi:hypothetical protein